MENLKNHEYQLLTENKEKTNKKLKIQFSWEEMVKLDDYKTGKDRIRFKRLIFIFLIYKLKIK
jgi:hypothetical protein